MQDDWGRRGVSVSLGRGRPRRSAKKGHRGLSATVPPRLVGPAGCKQRPPEHRGAGGALARGGLRFPFGQCRVDGGGPRDHRGSLSARRLEMRAAADGEGPLRGRPCVGRPPCAPRLAVVHISGLGKVPDWLGREFQRRGPGRSPGAPGLRVRPPGRPGALGRLSCPTERHFPRTPDGPGAPRFSGGSPLSGEGERSPTRSEGLRPAPAPRQAPLSGPRRPDFHTLGSTSRCGSHIRAGKSSRLARERISKEGARAEPRSSWASRPTSRTARGPRPALVPDREALSSDTRWAGCPPIFWRIPPLRGGGEEPHTLRGAPAGARPAAGASLRASAP